MGRLAIETGLAACKLGGGNGAFDGPWQFGPAKPCAKNLFGYPGNARELRECVRFTFVGKSNVGDAIIGLFAPRRPSYVLGRVRSVIVNAVKGVVKTWPFAHIGQEVIKAKPPIAKRNAATLIVREGWIGRIQTSRPHVLPRGVRWAFATFARRCVLVGRVAAGTPAASRGPISQSSGPYQRQASAFANAVPKNTSASPSSLGCYGKLAEFFACKVSLRTHSSTPSTVSRSLIKAGIHG